jgi:hypothetical protein
MPARTTPRPADERVEIFASYLVDEGWGIDLVLTGDGCFRKTDTLGTPGGGDSLVRCVGCVPAEVADELFAATRAVRLVSDEQQYPESIEAPRGRYGHMGRYSLLVLPSDGGALGPADEVSARALVPPMQRVLENAERVIEAEGRSGCSPQIEETP